ncbi:Coenzyme F420 hydrogenase subunit beta [ANME-1 cluster archaeon GoMg3.2]|nr:Coenzyme F420 hydrogenase subunit beta [ANME-1 cluster archaeon GoMg3.2]
MTDETIAQVVKDGLCTGCGTCVALCPNEAIELTINEKKGIYVPELDEEKCNNCGICYEVCPGHEVDFKTLNLEIFGKEPEDILIGNYLNCYSGHATDYDIRYNSASGGLITQLLIIALEEGVIDGALVTRMKKDNPLEPEPFIARTKEEIIEASKSKYCPVPANIALKEVLESEEGEKFAVVGLPCHIHGIRKAEQMNKKLKGKIILHIGIFCNHTSNFTGTEFLLNKLGIKKEEVEKLNYRGEGWPGGMLIELKNNHTRFIPPSVYWSSLFGLNFFTPTRCLLCSDGVCELADISFGDAWLPELSDDKIGKSIIVTKREIAEKILQAMKFKKKMELNEISAKKVIQSQAGMLYFKKKNLNARSKLFKAVPKKDNILESDAVDYILALFPYLNAYASSNSFLRRILCHIPSKLIWLYGVPYALIHSKKVKKDFDKFL